MTYHTVAFDMDGTLLNSDRQIVSSTIEAIDQIRQKGVEIILVTGRHHSAALPYYEQLKLKTPIICCNGSYLYNVKEQTHDHVKPLTREQAKKIQTLLQTSGFHYMVYTDKHMTYHDMDASLVSFLAWADTVPASVKPTLVKIDNIEEMVDNAECIIKFTARHLDSTVLIETKNRIIDEIGVNCEQSWVNHLDIAQQGNNKGKSLEKWALGHNILMENIVAFGDNHNDISMLESVGLGIAMGNSDQIVQQKADRTIGHNNSDAIAETLHALFLHPR